MGRGRKKRGDPIDGVLLLDKPQGLTSNRALQRCRALINARKGGHTGALDPLATGLLPLCFGQATKISSFLLDEGKTYAVCALAGVTTDTGDADGSVLETREVSLSEAGLRSVLEEFIGEYDQVPPMYSALKVNGQPLYKLARQGIEIERKARRVTAYDIRFRSMDAPGFCFEIDCSSGFYVRSLVEDIGRELGCGAHVTSLRRVRVGKLDVRDAVSLEAFEACNSREERIEHLISADIMLGRFPAARLDGVQCQQVKHGQSVVLPPEAVSSPGWVRIYDSRDRFLGLGTLDSEGNLAPRRLFIQQENA